MTEKEFTTLKIIAETFLENNIKCKDKKTNIIGRVEAVFRNGTIIISNQHIVRYVNISDIEFIKD